MLDESGWVGRHAVGDGIIEIIYVNIAGGAPVGPDYLSARNIRPVLAGGVIGYPGLCGRDDIIKIDIVVAVSSVGPDDQVAVDSWFRLVTRVGGDP